MEFKRARIQIKDELSDKFPHDLQLYNENPDYRMSLQEFEELAVERLKVLRILEQITLRGNTTNYEEWKNLVVEELKKQGLKVYQKLLTAPGCGQQKSDYEARRRDCLSHYILRFAYCQSEEYRRWFVARELELFKMRWSYLTAHAKLEFLKINNLDYNQVPEEELEKLEVVTYGMIKPNINEYYKVDWTGVPDLVRYRRVYVNNGLAYITSAELGSIIGTKFRSDLSHMLSIMASRLPIINEDERIRKLINNLHHSYVGKSYVNTGDKHVALQNIDKLAAKSFPLCMKQLHETLRKDHHLKHFGRQQYSLFLKGIGLSLEDALTFWKSEFTKKIDSDKFDKSYAYNLRHNYGKEGKRTNYTPYSCSKIISSGAAPGEQHGCPFRHYDANSLRQSLLASRIPQQAIHEILHFVDQRHFQLACAKYFEIQHGVSAIFSINHPNQYFEESQKILSEKEGDLLPSSYNIKSSTDLNQETTPSNKLSNDPMDDTLLEGMDWDNIP